MVANSRGQKKTWLIRILRLRQAATHPFLLEGVMKRHFERDDIEWLIEKLQYTQSNTPFIHQVGRWCEEMLNVREWPPQGEHLNLQEYDQLGACFDLLPQLEAVKKSHGAEEQLEDLCRRCGRVSPDPFQPKV
jgi:hypothetical protein